MAKAKSTGEARVLNELHQIGAKAGDVLVTDTDTIKSLTAQGSVDIDPEAVAYAKKNGAKVINYDADAPAAEAAQ